MAVSGLSRAGSILTSLYSPVLPERLGFFFKTAEKKYLSNLLIHDLKNQVGLSISQGLVGPGNTLAIFSEIELRANNLLKQLDSSEKDRTMIAFGRELLPLAKWSMGFDRKKTFLIVLQNSMEQRPTGGLIEGIGIAVIDKGKLLDTSWVGPDDVEASLSGSEDAPQPIRSMLGQEKLLFRDANWPIDGPGAAVQLKKMYERATGRGIDGAIFFSTAGLEDVLLAIGKDPIKEKSAFSGPEFVSQIASGLTGSLKSSPFQVIKGLLTGLQNENIFIVPFDPEQAKIASLSGIDGGNKKTLCPSQVRLSECGINSIYVVDSNLGANRADYFMKKSRRASVIIAPLTTSSTILDLAYLNTSTVENSSSVYRGYTRVVIPLSSIVKSVVSVENGEAVQIPTDNFIESGQHIVGFMLEVKPGESKMIKIAYSSTSKIPIERGTGSYVLGLKKQPGDSVSTEINIKLSDGITPLSVYPQAKVSGGDLSFKFPMVKSDSVMVEFAIDSLFR